MLTGYAESLSLACEGSGDSESADQWYLLAKDHAARLGDRLVASALGLGRAIVLRARGLAEPALDHAEQAFAFFESAGLTIFGALARLEWAATKLALGDVEVASEAAQAIRDDTSLASAAYHQLKADMILAQIESLQGRFSAAVERIAAHTEYILTESSNWQAAMYVRSFPGLLAVFAAAVGPARLPAHLLNCVTPTYAVPALRVARSRLSLADWRVLAGRLIDAEEIATLEAEYKSVPPVRVRVFGGFEVVTPNGPIAERSWRKRKARLLFAMLVTLQGRDVARDQLMEHMWPDMDEARSRNNFYVVWSTMKRALAGEVAGSVPDCFETVGGLCRSLPEFVSSDLDDFESIVRGLRRAEAVGGADDVLLACDRLAEVYRGDLLPGDLYEDWFAELRDRCRHTFCDALVSGVRILQERRETERAMDLLRRALAVDPWREDLYQLAMELQISRGQRSGAIETYITCQSKLRNELGIDPSVETRSLYQAVLAMEDEPTAAAPRRQ
jgi:DNA-binding SARP family transcriptional activator